MTTSSCAFTAVARIMSTTMATAKKRPFGSISDDQTPSQPRTKRHRATSQCHLRRLPDELLIMIAENLAGFDDPVTYMKLQEGKLAITHPKAHQDVSLVGLRHLSNTLSIEFERAFHKNGILAFKDEQSFMKYFDPNLLENDQGLAYIRLATERVRFINWRNLYFSDSFQEPSPFLMNLKMVHLGGVWKNKTERLKIHPSPRCGIVCQTLGFVSSICSIPLLDAATCVSLRFTFGPGRFGHDTICPDDIIDIIADGEADDTVKKSDFKELPAIWKHGGQDTSARCSSIVPMDKKELGIIAEVVEHGLLRGLELQRYRNAHARLYAAPATCSDKEIEELSMERKRAVEALRAGWYVKGPALEIE